MMVGSDSAIEGIRRAQSDLVNLPRTCTSGLQ